MVFTHHSGDLNIDHRIVHQAVVTACRPMPSLCVKKLHSFEIPSSTEWQAPGSQPFFSNQIVMWIFQKLFTLKLKH